MAAKNTPKSKLKTKPVIKAKTKKAIAKTANKATVKNKSKAPVKALKKTTAKTKATPRKATIVKRVTFTTQEFKDVQQMLAASNCQNLKEWITKKMAEQKLPA